MIYWPKLHCQCWVKLCLIFQPLYYNLKSLGDTEKVMSWKSKDFLTKNLLPLPLLIVFLRQLNGTKSQIFVWYLKEVA